MALAPTLTNLDRRVLGALPEGGRGWRLARIHGIAAKRSPVSLTDVRLVLRGLEALGLAENRCGWWRRAA